MSEFDMGTRTGRNRTPTGSEQDGCEKWTKNKITGRPTGKKKATKVYERAQVRYGRYARYGKSTYGQGKQQKRKEGHKDRTVPQLVKYKWGRTKWEEGGRYRAVDITLRQYGVVMRRHASAYKIPATWKQVARSVSQW